MSKRVPLRKFAPDYVPWFIGDTAYQIGSSLIYLPMTLLAYSITESTALTATITAAGGLTRALLALPAGIIVDSFDKKKLLRLSALLDLLVWGAVLVMFGLGEITATALIIVAVAQGFIDGTFGGLTNTLLRFIIPEKYFLTAQQRNVTRDQLVYFAGGPAGAALFQLHTMLPFAGNWLMSFGRLYSSFAIKTATPGNADALKQFDQQARSVSAEPVNAAHTTEQKAAGECENYPDQPTTVMGKIREWIYDMGKNVKFSITWIVRHRRLRWWFGSEVLYQCASFCMLPLMTLSLLESDTSPVIIGIVDTMFSVGMLIGGFLSAKFTKFFGGRNLVWLTPAVYALTLIMLLAVGTTPITFGIALIVQLLLVPASMAYSSSVVSLSAPKELMARCFAGPRVIMAVIAPIATFTIGVLLTYFGVAGALLVALVLCLGATVLALTPAVREWPEADQLETLTPLY